MSTPTTNHHERNNWRGPRSLTGFVTVTAIALLLIAVASARSAPATTQGDDGTNPTCDATPPAASTGATPAATGASTPSVIDQMLTAAQRAAQAGTPDASPGATPAADVCLDPPVPTGEDLIATAAALLEAATAAAAAAEEQAPTEPAAEPTESTESGEVTQALPAADIPSTNVQGFSFNLEASLTVDLATVIGEAPVYRLDSADYDAESAATLATALGIDGAVEDRGNGTFSASGNGELFVTPNLIQYLSPAPAGEGDLPDDATAIELAREWLRTSSLIQPDLGEGAVVSRDDATGRLVILFTPVEPSGLLAAYPSVTVSIGRGGVVLEVSSRWAAIQRADLYQLRPAEEAWRQVESGQGYIEVALEGSGIAQGSVVSGLVEYTAIDLAYTTAGPPGDGQFLVPIFAFTGTLTPEGSDQTYPIHAYVPGLAISDTPVGFNSPFGGSAS